MSLWRLFGGRRKTDRPAPSAGFRAWAVEAQALLDEFAADNRALGRDLPPAAYSQLRRIEDMLRPAIGEAREQPMLPERQYAVESMMQRLVPDTLAAFLRIPFPERGDNSRAAAMLLEQLSMLTEQAAQIAEDAHRESGSALVANLLFLEERAAMQNA